MIWGHAPFPSPKQDVVVFFLFFQTSVMLMSFVYDYSNDQLIFISFIIIFYVPVYM